MDDVEAVRAAAGAYRRVIVDVGTGDGRWLYRSARQHPDALYVGIDASAEAMRDVARRARRKPARGGLGNLLFLRAGVEGLPGGLEHLATEVHVQYPWGTLLQAVVRPDAGRLQRIARLLTGGGSLHLLVNAAVLEDAHVLRRMAIPPRSMQDLRADMVSSYAESGMLIRRWEVEPLRIRSSWAGRLGQGGAVATLCVEAERRWPR